MSLILKRNGYTPDPDRFLLYSGKLARRLRAATA
jgi:hypothetical protein